MKTEIPERFHIRLGSLSEPFGQWCTRNGMSPSEAIRKAVAELIDDDKDQCAHGVDYGFDCKQCNLEIFIESMPVNLAIPNDRVVSPTPLASLDANRRATAPKTAVTNGIGWGS